MEALNTLWLLPPDDSGTLYALADAILEECKVPDRINLVVMTIDVKKQIQDEMAKLNPEQKKRLLNRITMIVLKWLVVNYGS